MVNLNEYIADTDPNDDTDYFHIANISNPSPIMVYFQSSSSRVYSLEGRDELMTTSQWFLVGSQSNICGTGATMPMGDTNYRNNNAVLPINALVSVHRDETRWMYCCGVQPFAVHEAQDRKAFLLTVAQLIDVGACRPVEIVRTFGAPKRSVPRAAQRYRQGGAAAFFRTRNTRRGGTVFTAPVLAQAQELLDEGILLTGRHLRVRAGPR